MTPALNDAEINERLARLDGWERAGDTIQKTWRTDSYLAGIALATAIGVISEGLDHHPGVDHRLAPRQRQLLHARRR